MLTLGSLRTVINTNLCALLFDRFHFISPTSALKNADAAFCFKLRRQQSNDTDCSYKVPISLLSSAFNALHAKMAFAMYASLAIFIFFVQIPSVRFAFATPGCGLMVRYSYRHTSSCSSGRRVEYQRVLHSAVHAVGGYGSPRPMPSPVSRAIPYPTITLLSWAIPAVRTLSAARGNKRASIRK